jgi:integrase
VAGVGAPTIRKTMVMLQSMLRAAVEWERVASNPVRATRKPSVKRTRDVRPLPPFAVEQLRAWLTEHRGDRDATLVSVLAYAGVRPQEALALRWRSIGERTLLAEEAVAQGKLKGQKTNRPPRTVRLLGPLRQDLAEWWIAAGRPEDAAFVFPAAGGGPWPLHDWQNWRRRTFTPAAEAVGLDGAVPYDLRHSFASLLVHEGESSVVDIASYLGHAPSQTLDTYSHVIEGLRGAEKLPADEQILRARREIRPISGPQDAKGVPAGTPDKQETPPERGRSKWAIQDSNLGPLPYQEGARRCRPLPSVRTPLTPRL